MNKYSKVALITGAAKRIGATIAHSLHDSGMNVIIHYRSSEDEAASLSDELNTKRVGSAITVQADLLDIASHQKIIATAINHWDRLDVLIHNASTYYATPFGNANENQWDDLIGSNLKSAFFLAQTANEFLKQSQGTIINIADIQGLDSKKDYSIYCVAKAGLIMLTKALAKDLGPEIRVNAIAPGPILWPENDEEIIEERKQEIIKRSVLQKAGTPEDITNAISYIIGASYVTGEILLVDGGGSLAN